MANRRTSSVNDPAPDEEPKTKADLRQDALSGVMQIAQLVTVGTGQFADAGAIGVFGPPMVDETVKLAENNTKVASKVDLLIEIGPYAGLVAAAIPFLAQIFVNHGLVKPEMFANAGVMPPDMLAEQMKMEMMKRALDAQRQQMQMAAEMEAMRAEMENEMRAQAANAPHDGNDYGEYRDTDLDD